MTAVFSFNRTFDYLIFTYTNKRIHRHETLKLFILLIDDYLYMNYKIFLYHLDYYYLALKTNFTVHNSLLIFQFFHRTVEQNVIYPIFLVKFIYYRFKPFKIDFYYGIGDASFYKAHI